MSDSVKIQKELLEQLNKLGAQVDVAVENGLYKGIDDALAQQLDDHIRNALVKVNDSNSLPEATLHIFDASRSFYKAWHQQGWLWRACCEYSLYHQLVNTASILASSILLVRFHETISQAIPIQYCVAGLVGAALKGCYWPIYQANRGLLRKAWIAESAVGTFIGIVLAGAIYFLLSGGLLMFGDGQIAPDDNLAIILCGFAGYNWKWALDKISGVAISTGTKK